MLLSKRISKGAIDALSKASSRYLYLTGPPLPSPPSQPPQAASDPSPESVPPSAKSGVSVPSPKPGREATTATSISEECRRVLRHWLTMPQPLLPQSLLLAKCGIKGGAKQEKFKRALVAAGLITLHELPRGKGKVIIWDPTAKAYELAGVEPRPGKTRGGFLHQGFAQLIAEQARRKGYTVDLECYQTNGKAIDLVLRRREEQIWIELGMSSADNELSGILRDLSCGIVPTRIIVACRDRKMRDRMLELAAEPSLITVRNRIQVVLVCDIVTFEKE